jgi:putative ABC transport system permease protein
MTDLRDAIRALRATPVVTAVAMLSLALGIGANTAIFSILDAVMLRVLPVKDPARLTIISMGANDDRSFTNPIWEQIRDRQEPFDGAFAWSSTRFNLAPGGPTEYVDGIWASGGFFQVLGVPAILGRTFTPADDRRGGGPDGAVAVISYSFWQRRFDGAADIVGRALTIERVPFTIVGVTGPEFFGADVGRTFDVAIPLGAEPLIRGKESSLDRRSSWWLSIMVRRRADQSLDAATAALRGLQPQVRDATMPPDYREEDRASYLRDAFELKPASGGSSGFRNRYQRPLTAMMVVVGLVLLIACANIANLLLARATARRHELSVRLALGASRFRLTRQLMVESLVLSACGALLGLLVALWGSRLLVRQLSSSTNNVFIDLALDWRMLAFTATVAVTTAMLFGTAPALRATRVQPNESLKERGRGLVGDSRFGLGNALVVVQVALSLMLVIAAGLFLRTFWSLATLDLGFQRRGLLVANVNAQRLQLEPRQRLPVFERLRDEAAAVPGVANATISVVTPVSGSSWQWGIDAVDGVIIPTTGDNFQPRSTYANIVSPGWFDTFGVRVIAGRDFTAADRDGSVKVTIVNEAFARKFMPGQNPIGHRVRQMGFPSRPAVEYEIVGYVADAVYRSLRDPVPPTLYISIAQYAEPPSSAAISVRSASRSPALLTKPLATAFGTVNRDVSITFRPLDDQVNAALIQERIVAMLSGFFGGLALLLAGLGLYGVTSYAVGRRRTEIGIRMALGAAPSSVVRMVLSRVAVLVGLGVAIGSAISYWVSPLVSTLLYRVPARDLTTLLGAAAILSAIGAIAGAVPARRAAVIDPARVLREG